MNIISKIERLILENNLGNKINNIDKFIERREYIVK